MATVGIKRILSRKYMRVAFIDADLDFQDPLLFGNHLETTTKPFVAVPVL